VPDRLTAAALRVLGDQQHAAELRGKGLKRAAGAGHKLTQRQAALAAGLSKRQEIQATRVATVPAEEFEAAIKRFGSVMRALCANYA
jgi:hypothetical protein